MARTTRERLEEILAEAEDDHARKAAARAGSVDSAAPRCPECKDGGRLIKDDVHGELVCEGCGLALDDNIDQGPDWRAFDAEDSEAKSHAGAPMTYTIHNKGLSTEIGWKNKDAYGKAIPSRNRAQLYRLRKWQRRLRVSNATERNLAYALGELDRYAGQMSLPRNVRETAAMTYRKAVNKNLIRGRSIESVVAASLYAGCRKCDVPRTLDEVAYASRLSRKEVGRTYRFMTRTLKLKLAPTSPRDYIDRFCSELKLTNVVVAKTLEIITAAESKDLTEGRGPTGTAAAVIYIASHLCNERRTQREVADVGCVTEVTIRNRYKELTEKLNIHMPL